MPKVGIGYDIHRLVPGRKLFLGGIEIPHSRGLEGHSDADVLLHAICDAILGAMGCGDIGEHFPNTDPRFKDISSLHLLRQVEEIRQARGFVINNVDAVVIAEEPKIKEYKQQMCEAISGALDLDSSSVNIKATTNEGIGSIGAKEGIAAYAVAMLSKESI